MPYFYVGFVKCIVVGAVGPHKHRLKQKYFWSQKTNVATVVPVIEQKTTLHANVLLVKEHNAVTQSSQPVDRILIFF